MVRTPCRTRQGNGSPKAGRDVRILPGQSRQGRLGQEAVAAASDISDGLIGVLCVMEVCSTFKLAYGEGPASLRRPADENARLVLLLHGQRPRAHPCPAADLRAVHLPDLRQRPRVRGPTTPEEGDPLRADRQLLHDARRSGRRPAVRRSLRPSCRGRRSSKAIRAAGQSAAGEGTRRPDALLGHRSGGVRHRHPLRRRRFGSIVPATLGVRFAHVHRR